MQKPNLAKQVSDSLKFALEKDLSAIEVRGVNHDTNMIETLLARPEERDVSMYAFPQRWGNSTLGFHRPKRISLPAVTTAMTTVVVCGNEAVIYFGGQFCYVMDLSDEDTQKRFKNDLSRFNMAHIYEAKTRYKLKKTYEEQQSDD